MRVDAETKRGSEKRSVVFVMKLLTMSLFLCHVCVTSMLVLLLLLLLLLLLFSPLRPSVLKPYLRVEIKTNDNSTKRIYVAQTTLRRDYSKRVYTRTHAQAPAHTSIIIDLAQFTDNLKKIMQRVNIHVPIYKSMVYETSKQSINKHFHTKHGKSHAHT